MATYIFIGKKRSLFKRVTRSVYFVIFIASVYYLSSFFFIERFEDVEYGHRLFERLKSAETNFYSSNQACRFPILNPFDPSILSFVQHPPPLNCTQHHPQFTFVVGNEVFLNESLAKKHNLTNVQYRYFRRANGSDSSIFYGDMKPFPKHSSLSLSSWSGAVIRGVYDKNLAYTIPYSSIEPLYGLQEKQSKTAPTYRPNVVIIGIDSVSRSNVIRNLPLTYRQVVIYHNMITVNKFRYLTQEIGGWDMRGYIKIDDNTFPNMVAVLTGHKATVQKSEFLENPQKDFVDNWPFIWKNFSDNGYSTLLAEEQPGIFSYKAAGFKKQPTDVYLRSYGTLLNDGPSYEPYCFGDKPEALLILESIERFMESQESIGNPYFAFSFLWKLSHDLTYEIERLDEILVKWLERIHKKSLLRNTLFFLTSDHGNRFDKIRSTMIGRYEERMPFLFLRPPEKMLQMFPNLEDKLSGNLYRMTCHYDFYETLVDIVRGDYGNLSRPRLRNRGQSLFTEIPESRTCDDVDIEDHFCVCQEEEKLDLLDPLVKSTSRAVISEINKNLEPVQEKCLQVELGKILSAEKLTPNAKVRNNNRYHYNKLLGDQNVTNLISFVRITIMTNPNNGVFEAVVQVTQASASNSTIISAVTGYDSISRINSYGQSANCVSLTHRYLEKFCTCKEAFL